jgi:hypothetical protein
MLTMLFAGSGRGDTKTLLLLAGFIAVVWLFKKLWPVKPPADRW